MALGYVIALVLIGAGSALFVLGTLAARQEARARAADLKAFLKTGVAPAMPAPDMSALWATSRLPAEILSLQASRTPQAHAARALRRAYDPSQIRAATA